MTFTGNFGDPKTERDIRSAKRFNFFALGVLIVLILAAFILYLQLQQKQQELQEKSLELADSTDRLRRFRNELEAVQSKLAKREQETEHQLRQLTRSVENRQFDSALVMARGYNLGPEAREKCIFVNLYVFQPAPKVVKTIQSMIVPPKFILSVQDTIDHVTEWMGDASAVYYYSNASARMAMELAIDLSKATGVHFKAIMGNAEDAPKYSSHQWIRIQYLGEGTQQQQ
ncbi:MAG: hypothetical protein U0176_17220 [Bacteroidia bacterium]